MEKIADNNTEFKDRRREKDKDMTLADYMVDEQEKRDFPLGCFQPALSIPELGGSYSEVVSELKKINRKLESICEKL